MKLQKLLRRPSSAGALFLAGTAALAVRPISVDSGRFQLPVSAADPYLADSDFRSGFFASIRTSVLNNFLKSWVRLEEVYHPGDAVGLSG